MNRNLIYLGLVLVGMGAILFKPFDGYFLVKALPILFLAAIAWRNFSGTTRTLLCLALILSAAGDVFLALSFQHNFMFGLGAFLLAQLAYGGLFFTQLDRSRLKPILIAALFPLLSLGIVIPTAGELAIAVGIYSLAIGFMLVTAWGHRSPGLFIALGATSFVISDSLIGINKFMQPIWAESVWIMATYYLAQWLIFTGVDRYSHTSTESNEEIGRLKKPVN